MLCHIGYRHSVSHKHKPCGEGVCPALILKETLLITGGLLVGGRLAASDADGVSHGYWMDGSGVPEVVIAWWSI